MIRNLNGIADAAQLDGEERAAVLQAVNEARVDDVDDGVVWLRRAQPSFDTSQ